MPDYQTIRTKVADKVATIWLNRPEHRNAFSGDMTRELHEAFGRFEADDEVRAIVVTGTGKYFSAGADLGSRGGDTFARPDGGAPPRPAPARRARRAAPDAHPDHRRDERLGRRHGHHPAGRLGHPVRRG